MSLAADGHWDIAPPIVTRVRGRKSSVREPAEGKQSADGIQFTSPCSPYFHVKPILDWVLAAALLFPALPLLALSGLVVLVCDGWPVFYRQTRVGKNGHTFRIWKLRTMCHAAEARTGPVWSGTADGRVTRSGRWLRATHLDELPQLLNVLVGDMSLIGPRPERPEFVSELVKGIPEYMERLQVRPGITGLAQIRLGYDTSLADVKRKVELDLTYIRHASLFGDVLILLLTAPHLCKEFLCKRAGKRRKVCTTAAHDLLQQPRIGLFAKPQDTTRNVHAGAPGLPQEAHNPPLTPEPELLAT